RRNSAQVRYEIRSRGTELDAAHAERRNVELPNDARAEGVAGRFAGDDQELATPFHRPRPSRRANRRLTPARSQPRAHAAAAEQDSERTEEQERRRVRRGPSHRDRAALLRRAVRVRAAFAPAIP